MPRFQDAIPGDPQRAWQRRPNTVFINPLHLAPESTTVSAQAQVSIDVSKITCDEYVHDKIPTPDFVSFSAVGSLETRAMLSRWLIAAWLSGYYHAKRDNWIIDLESFEDNVSKLTKYCYDEKNFKVQS